MESWIFIIIVAAVVVYAVVAVWGEVSIMPDTRPASQMSERQVNKAIHKKEAEIHEKTWKLEQENRRDREQISRINEEYREKVEKARHNKYENERTVYYVAEPNLDLPMEPVDGDPMQWSMATSMKVVDSREDPVRQMMMELFPHAILRPPEGNVKFEHSQKRLPYQKEGYRPYHQKHEFIKLNNLNLN